MFDFLWYTHAMKSSRRRFRETSLGGPRCGKHPSRLHYQAKKPSERKCPQGLPNRARCPTSMRLLQLHTKQTSPSLCTTVRMNVSLSCALQFSNASCSIPVCSINLIDLRCIFNCSLQAASVMFRCGHYWRQVLFLPLDALDTRVIT